MSMTRAMQCKQEQWKKYRAHRAKRAKTSKTIVRVSHNSSFYSPKWVPRIIRNGPVLLFGLLVSDQTSCVSWQKVDFNPFCLAQVSRSIGSTVLTPTAEYATHRSQCPLLRLLRLNG